jgi:hypothetical protein
MSAISVFSDYFYFNNGRENGFYNCSSEDHPKNVKISRGPYLDLKLKVFSKYLKIFFQNMTQSL